jgi:hypothetical protein
MLMQTAYGYVIISSTIYFGFRFNTNIVQDFSFDDWLMNRDEAVAMYNCDIIKIDNRKIGVAYPIDQIKKIQDGDTENLDPVEMGYGDYAVVLKDTVSSANKMFGYTSKRFKIKDITKDEIGNMEKFCEYFKIPFVQPYWRHSMTFDEMSYEQMQADFRDLSSDEKSALDEMREKMREELNGQDPAQF